MDEARGISKLDLKRRNRKQILLAIRETGKLARVDIAKRLALTRAAVTIITNTMVQQGILTDLPPAPVPDHEPRSRGRRKTLICINPNYKFVLGAAVTEHFISLGLANLAGEVLDKASMPLTDSTGQQEIVSFIAKNARQMMQNSSLKEEQILGIGVGIIPSRIKQFRGEIKPGSLEFPRFAALLGMETDLPVHCCNLIGLYALANIDYPANRHINQVLLYSGDRYHTAVVADNTLVSGSGAETDLINRFVISPDGESDGEFPKGSVGAELIRPVLLRRAAAILKADPAALTMEQVNAAYAEGDKKIISLLNGAAEKLAYLVYNIAAANSAQRVVLQSFAFNPLTEAIMRDKLAELNAGAAQTVAVDLSRLPAEHSFVAGSNWCAEKQFIEMGGMARTENGAASPEP